MFSTHHLDCDSGVLIVNTNNNSIILPNNVRRKQGNVYSDRSENLEFEIKRLIEDFIYYLFLKKA